MTLLLNLWCGRHKSLGLFYVGLIVLLGPVSNSALNAADKGLRDPTDPSGNGGSLSEVSVTEGGDPGFPKLSTIILGESSRLAVIDGKRIRESDRISGYLVKEILRKEVVLEKSGEEIRIRLPGYVKKIGGGSARHETVSDGMASSSDRKF